MASVKQRFNLSRVGHTDAVQDEKKKRKKKGRFQQEETTTEKGEAGEAVVDFL